MNDPFSGLEQTLERATAASDAPQSDLEPDTQSLREAWFEFGRLLEAAQPSAPPLERWQPPPASRRWSPAVVAAVAASLLILVGVCGAGIYWTWGGGGTSSGILALSGNVASNQHVKPAASAVPHLPSQTKQPAKQLAKSNNLPNNSSNNSSNDLQWDDSLDRQIAETGQDVALAQSDLGHAFDMTDFVRYRLQQAQQDFDTNKL